MIMIDAEYLSVLMLIVNSFGSNVDNKIRLMR